MGLLSETCRWGSERKAFQISLKNCEDKQKLSCLQAAIAQAVEPKWNDTIHQFSHDPRDLDQFNVPDKDDAPLGRAERMFIPATKKSAT